MRLVIAVFKAHGCHVRVYLRRAKAAVAEQFLDTADVGPGVEQVRGERVSERMWASAAVEAGGGEILPQHPGDASGRESSAEAVEKQRTAPVAAFPGPQSFAFRQPRLDGRGCRAAE